MYYKGLLFVVQHDPLCLIHILGYQTLIIQLVQQSKIEEKGPK